MASFNEMLKTALADYAVLGFTELPIHNYHKYVMGIWTMHEFDWKIPHVGGNEIMNCRYFAVGNGPFDIRGLDQKMKDSNTTTANVLRDFRNRVNEEIERRTNENKRNQVVARVVAFKKKHASKNIMSLSDASLKELQELREDAKKYGVDITTI